MDEEDVQGLRESIGAYDNFDQVALAVRLEKHDLLEMRRIGALLYKRNKRWEQSIALSKKDEQFRDAIDTAAESSDANIAESILRYFVEKEDRESFAAALFTCYRLVRPDLAMELAWRNRMTDYVMPFMIQYVRDTNARLAALEAKVKPKEEAHPAEAAMDGMGYAMPGFNNGMLALANEAYNPGMGYGHHGAAAYGGGGLPAPMPQVPGMPGYGMPGYGQPGMF